MNPNSLKRLSFCLLWLTLVVQGCSSIRGANEEADSVATPGLRSDVVMAALSEVGTRYVYGAEAPGAALDCSALTQYAYRAAGMDIPRVSMAQRRAARPVDPANVKPGDLVFFKMGRGRYHVGLMVDKHQFVHASTSGKQVRLSRLDTPYWQRHLMGAGAYLK